MLRPPRGASSSPTGGACNSAAREPDFTCRSQEVHKVVHRRRWTTRATHPMRAVRAECGYWLMRLGAGTKDKTGNCRPPPTAGVALGWSGGGKLPAGSRACRAVIICGVERLGGVIPDRLGSPAASQEGNFLAESDEPMLRAHTVIRHHSGTSQTPGECDLTGGIASFILTASHVLGK